MFKVQEFDTVQREIVEFCSRDERQIVEPYVVESNAWTERFAVDAQDCYKLNHNGKVFDWIRERWDNDTTPVVMPDLTIQVC